MATVLLTLAMLYGLIGGLFFGLIGGLFCGLILGVISALPWQPASAKFGSLGRIALLETLSWD